MINGSCATILLLLTILISANILATFVRYFIYKLTHEEQQSRSAMCVDEQPVLVLEYNKNSQILAYWIPAMFLITLGICMFWFADFIANRNTHSNTFFSLSIEQTYILYYFTWKFQGLFLSFVFCLLLIKSFNRKVIFYNNAVVVENSIMGRRELSLDENVKRNESGGISKWIYDERKGINLQVYSKKFMELTHKQEKLLTEIMNRIPKKNKIFMII